MYINLLHSLLHSQMGMGFNFITSPDKIDPPPPAARSCLENSLLPGSDDEPEESSETSETSSSATFCRLSFSAVLASFYVAMH